MSNYQTKPLEQYKQRYLEVAEDIIKNLKGKIPEPQVKRYKGSFSILGTSTQQTVAKIVLADENSSDPFIREGVYVAVRSNGASGEAIWDQIPSKLPWMFEQMKKIKTASISPQYHAEFIHLPVMAGDDFGEIATLLTECSKI